MSKRALSPGYLPPPKRSQTSLIQGPRKRPALSFNNSLYDELILCIFSHLSWFDLCLSQSTSRNWSRLAADNELWRTLYLSVFGRSRLRGARGFKFTPLRSDGREVKSLPSKAKGGVPDVIKNWKWMFRISSNWRKGRCATERLEASQASNTVDPAACYPTYVLLAGPWTFTASARPSILPTINLIGANGSNHALHRNSTHAHNPVQITALAIDQSPPLVANIRLVYFLSTGEFTIFSLDPSLPLVSREELTYTPARTQQNLPIIQSAYHHPLLVSLSHSFSLSVYDVSNAKVRHVQTLTSFTSFPPTSLVISTPRPMTYRLVLAYAVPVYPSHWSVGATELIISGGSDGVRSISTNLFQSTTADRMTVISVRTVRALDVPPGWIDEAKLLVMREQWARKVCKVADTQTDGKWVVLAPGEIRSPNSSNAHSELASFGSIQSRSFSPLQLYRLYLPPTNSIASPSAKLSFVRSLHGQMGPISSLAVADGRCTSLGLDGSLWVWDLEAGTGAQVSGCNPDHADDATPPTGMITFDERRIVTSINDRLTVRKFDI